VSGKWRSVIDFEPERLFHTCGKVVEMMSVETVRLATSKAFQQIDEYKPSPMAERV
jgi:hypothetical protein